MDAERELVFARYLVQSGALGRDEVKHCLRLQSGSWPPSGVDPLPELIVAEGLLDAETLERHLAEFEELARLCAACGALFLPVEGAHVAQCQRCSGSGSGAGRRAPADESSGIGASDSTADSDSGVQHPDAPPAALGAGQRFGDYEIIDVVARGGMGVVYRTRHISLGRLVALKVLREGRRGSPEHVKRFKREAKAVARLDHENIVRVHEFGHKHGHYFFTMDFVAGGSFESFLTDPERDVRRGVELVRDVVRALAFAHTQGVIHRDIKPANVLIDDRGRGRITDFGLARTMDTTTTLTQEGELLGTPLYMSPEQLRGRVRQVDERSDIYGVGVMLYQHLAGRLPHLAQTMVDLQYKVVKEEPEPLRSLSPSVDPALEVITHKCLEKRRDDRYQTALELADDLDRWLGGERIAARPPSLASRMVRRVQRGPGGVLGGVAIGLVVLGAIGGAGYLGWKSWVGRQADMRRRIQMLDLDIATRVTGARAALKAARTDLRVEGPGAAANQLERARELLAAAEAAPGAEGVAPETVAELLARHELAGLRLAWLELAAEVE
jgi:hypothetical protein